MDRLDFLDVRLTKCLVKLHVNGSGKRKKKKQLLLVICAALLSAGCSTDTIVLSVHEAAARGYLESVRLHLSRGTDIDVRDKNGMTPLMIAIANNRNGTAEFLIEEGADVNAVDNARKSSLDYALESKNGEIGDLLRNRAAQTIATSNEEGKCND